ncbi:uncharacterized protein [Palaemon carinicauda]|uniref:uncharacterized protein n=1 Tax=Palaemon carinicauda TaxID=392227 RepID=UPI0035B5E115
MAAFREENLRTTVSARASEIWRENKSGDHFKVLVDDQPMPLISKFINFQSVLEGEARGVLQDLIQTTANYKIACELLEERYDDPENIISAHLQTLMQLGSFRNTKTGIHTSSLRKLQDDLVGHVRSLEALRVGGEQYGRILVAMTLALLPHDIRLDWSRSGRKRDLDGLLKFLQREVEGRERTEAIKMLGLGKSEEPNVERRTKNYSHSSASALQISSEGSASKTQCAFCGKLHPSESCIGITKYSPFQISVV